MVRYAAMAYASNRRPLFYAILVLTLYLAYLVLSPFMVALTWAVIFAILFRDTQTTLAARIGANAAAVVTTLIVAVTIVAPAVALVSALAHEVPQVTDYLQEASRSAPHQIDRAWAFIRTRSPFAVPDDPTELIVQGARRLVTFLAPRAGGVLIDFLATIGDLIAMLFALFFFLRDGEAFRVWFRDRLPFSREDAEHVMSNTRDLVIASVGAGLVVAAVQGMVGGVAFWLLGLGAPVIWGLVIAVCSLIPVVGAALVWVPAGIGLLIAGKIGHGLLMFAIGGLGISMVDNVLRPIILSGRTAASGLVIFFGLLGGVAAFGFVGLVIGPIILVTAGSLLDILRRIDTNDSSVVPDSNV